MSDYKELISDLRDAEQANWKRLSLDAADAIEALQAEIREFMQRCAECGDELVHLDKKEGMFGVEKSS